ncbi:MAG: hypothetical protein ACEY3B_00765 [Wolbachia sp.]
MMLIFELLAKCTNVTGSSKNCVTQVADTGSFITVSFQSGIQVAYKQTSIESGYNVFDEIAERLDSRLE